MNMQTLTPDLVAEVVIPYFLRSLMRVERERLNLSQKDVAFRAGWSSSTWGAYERGERDIDKDTWAEAKDALMLKSANLVRRLNAFINRYPSLWFERKPDGIHICERPVTSPRGLRSGKVVNFDLNPIRPVLYQTLASYAAEASEVIAEAVIQNFYKAQKNPELSSQIRSSRSESATEEEKIEIINETILNLTPEKLALMERVIDKFQRFSAKELALAYQHFSLSLKKH
jgi:transcriptional regulator with XRE-family HTH domain